MKVIKIGQVNEIEPIEWIPYKGEEVCVNLTIRNGKRIRDMKYFEDKVKAVPRGNAYCIGNGPSRKDFDLNKLKASGQTYGCNALYRDFMPDCLVAVDTKMVLELNKAGIQHKVETWTNPNRAYSDMTGFNFF